MATNPYLAGPAEMAARLEAFNKNLLALSDEELFEEFRSIKKRQTGAATGNGEGESEDLLYKSLSAEAEISRRSGGQGLLAYNKWLTEKKSEGT